MSADPLATAAVFEAVRLQSDRPEFTLSNGVVLRTRPIAREAVRRAFGAVQLPRPPITYIESKRREEPNPNHPDYIEALERAHEARLAAVRRTLLALGVEVVSVPDGMDPPEGDAWWNDLRAAGIDVRLDPPAMRRLDWLEMYCLAGTMDAAVTFAKCAATYGLFESEVRDSIDFFRLNEERRAATGSGNPEAVG